MHFDLHLLLALILTRLPAEAKGHKDWGLLPDYVTRNLNPNVSPCKDFYAHACGNWSNVHATDTYTSVLDQLDYDYQERLATLLERESSGKEARFLQLPRDYYASCRRSLDMPQVVAFLEQLVSSRTLGNDHLTVALTAAFRLEVLVDMSGDKIKDIWLQLLIRNNSAWDRNETNRDPLNRQQFVQLWQQLPWRHRQKEGFWRALSQLEGDMMREDVHEDEDELPDLFVDKQHTPAFWMLPWRRSPPSISYIRRVAALLAAKEPNFLIAYILLRLRLTAGRGEIKPWHVKRSECAEQCRQLLSHPSVWLLEKDQPRLSEEPMLQRIFQTLKHRFGQKLRANRNGFSRTSVRFMLSKLEHMTLRLSVLPRRKSVYSLERRIERHYRDLNLNATDYFGNLLATLLYSTEQYLLTAERLFLPWLLGMASVKPGDPLPVQVHGFGSFGSPFYMQQKNTLVVPLSLVGPPVYTPDQWELLTYSSLGFILGHELSHGFTPDAVATDSRGREQRNMAKELEGLSRFQEQVVCLRRRFGGEQLEEKWADFNGLELAYSAYFDAAEGESRWVGNSIDLGSTQREQQQQFFLNFAQFFCSDMDSSQDDDDHGTDRSRVNEAVGSFQPFQTAFECPENPFKKKYHKWLQCRLY